MKTVSIRELHASTGKLVRASQQEPLIIPEHGFSVVYSHDQHLLAAAPHFDLKGEDLLAP